MAIASLQLPVQSRRGEEPRRKRWTRAECALLETSGILDRQNLELVEGDLIDKRGKSRPHVHKLMLLMGWLTQVFGVPFVNSEVPIDVAPEDNPTNEPQPDAIVLRPSLRTLRQPSPNPQTCC